MVKVGKPFALDKVFGVFLPLPLSVSSRLLLQINEMLWVCVDRGELTIASMLLSRRVAERTFSDGVRTQLSENKMVWR